MPLLPQVRPARIDESDAGNTKLCHRLDAQGLTDDDLRFLQQIGLKWARRVIDMDGVTESTLIFERQ